MSRSDIPLPQPREFLKTTRNDRWWAQPSMVLIGLLLFIIYGTWAAFQADHYFLRGDHTQAHLGYDALRNYLSPFYAPTLWDVPDRYSGHAWFGEKPAWWPAWLFFSPALLILWAPGGFRVTCYYYRGAYYKAFWGDPPACGVGEPKFRGKKYRGERWMPLVLQNVHRYFLYLALVFLVILTWDAIISYKFFIPDGEGGYRAAFGIGVGTLILTLNPILLGGYTLGCHTLRHLVGGRFDQLSRRPVQKKTYDCVTCLNRRHLVWAWLSLVWVAWCDVYIRLCSMGVWHDYMLIGPF